MKNEIGELVICYWGMKKMQKRNKNYGIGTIKIG